MRTKRGRWCYLIILFLALVVGTLAFLKVGRCMNTLAQDEAFRESYRMLDRQEMKQQMERWNMEGHDGR